MHLCITGTSLKRAGFAVPTYIALGNQASAPMIQLFLPNGIHTNYGSRKTSARLKKSLPSLQTSFHMVPTKIICKDIHCSDSTAAIYASNLHSALQNLFSPSRVHGWWPRLPRALLTWKTLYNWSASKPAELSRWMCNQKISCATAPAQNFPLLNSCLLA